MLAPRPPVWPGCLHSEGSRPQPAASPREARGWRQASPCGEHWQKAGMADTLEAAGQDVKQEPPDELMGLEAHDLLLGAMRIIAPCKADMRIADGGQPAVRDRDPVGVAAEIGQDLAGSGK